jgi:soluble lytic murein transglycosylase-like protein
VVICRSIRVWYRLIALYCAALTTGAAQPNPPNESLMQASIKIQRASVRAQVHVATPAPTHGFFTVPWPSPVMLPSTPAECDPLPPSDLQPLIAASARKHGVKAELVRAVIDQESDARPCAVSARGAQGLMQIMPDTAADLNLTAPFDPKQNVDAGVRYLKTLLDHFKGDLTLALGAYNAGLGVVDKEGGLPHNSETQNYVKQILASLKESEAVSPPQAPAENP